MKKSVLVRIGLLELQEMLGVVQNEFKYFKRSTLDPAIRDLSEKTDINVEYRKITKSKKVIALEFTINKRDYATLQDDIPSTNKEWLDILYEQCDHAYTKEQLQKLVILCEQLTSKPTAFLIGLYYQITASHDNIKDIYKYTLAVINRKVIETSPPPRRQGEIFLQYVSFLTADSSSLSVQLEKIDTNMNEKDLNVSLDNFDSIIYDSTKLPWE